MPLMLTVVSGRRFQHGVAPWCIQSVRLHAQCFVLCSAVSCFDSANLRLLSPFLKSHLTRLGLAVERIGTIERQAIRGSTGAIGHHVVKYLYNKFLDPCVQAAFIFCDQKINALSSAQTPKTFDASDNAPAVDDNFCFLACRCRVSVPEVPAGGAAVGCCILCERPWDDYGSRSRCSRYGSIGVAMVGHVLSLRSAYRIPFVFL